MKFIERRAWGAVDVFYQELVNGKAALSEVNPRLRDVYEPCVTGRWEPEREGAAQGDESASSDRSFPEGEHATSSQTAGSIYSNNKNKKRRGNERITYRVTVAYHGPAFCGFMKQKGMKTVQGTLEDSITPLLSEGKRACCPAAGRTDKGVHGSAQVVTFSSWTDIPDDEVLTSINNAAPGELYAHSIERVPRQFHPTFGALWRRYVYMFPLQSYEARDPVVSTQLVDGLLAEIRGQNLDFCAFARDVEKGKDTFCNIQAARAVEG
eukprot:9046315-Pyramimonas_sp.AAC.1